MIRWPALLSSDQYLSSKGYNVTVSVTFRKHKMQHKSYVCNHCTTYEGHPFSQATVKYPNNEVEYL